MYYLITAFGFTETTESVSAEIGKNSSFGVKKQTKDDILSVWYLNLTIELIKHTYK